MGRAGELVGAGEHRLRELAAILGEATDAKVRGTCRANCSNAAVSGERPLGPSRHICLASTLLLLLES